MALCFSCEMQNNSPQKVEIWSSIIGSVMIWIEFFLRGIVNLETEKLQRFIT
jgi:hypothetical protein